MSNKLSVELDIDVNNKKALKQIQKVTDSVAEIDGGVVVTLDYNGNIDGFNKALQTIINNDPSLTVQFQYDMNKKALIQTQERIAQMEEIQLKFGVDEKNYVEIADEIENNLNSLLSKYFTGNIGFDSVKKALQDAFDLSETFRMSGFENAGEELLSRVEEIIDSNDLEIKLKPVNVFDLRNIEKERENVEKIKNSMLEMESTGNVVKNSNADSDELDALLKRVEMLEAEMKSVQSQMQNMDGSGFKTAESFVSNLADTLQSVLDKINDIQNTKIDLSKIWVHGGDLSHIGKDFRKSDNMSRLIELALWDGMNPFGSGINFVTNNSEAIEDLDSIAKQGNTVNGNKKAKGYLIDSNRLNLNMLKFKDEDQEEDAIQALNQYRKYIVRESEVLSELSDAEIEHLGVYDGLEDVLSTNDLYSVLKNAIPNFTLTYDEFESFLSNQIETVKSYGKAVKKAVKDGEDEIYVLESATEDLTKVNDTNAELLKRIGYDGYLPVSGGENDSFYQGGVIFDREESVVKSIVGETEQLSEILENSADLNPIIKKYIDNLHKTAKRLASELANAMVEGYAEGQDSNSPSEDAKKLVHDFTDGVEVGVNEDLSKINELGEKLGNTFVDGFNIAIKNADIDIDRDLNIKVDTDSNKQNGFSFTNKKNAKTVKDEVDNLNFIENPDLLKYLQNAQEQLSDNPIYLTLKLDQKASEAEMRKAADLFANDYNGKFGTSITGKNVLDAVKEAERLRIEENGRLENEYRVTQELEYQRGLEEARIKDAEDRAKYESELKQQLLYLDEREAEREAVIAEAKLRNEEDVRRIRDQQQQAADEYAGKIKQLVKIYANAQKEIAKGNVSNDAKFFTGQYDEKGNMISKTINEIEIDLSNLSNEARNNPLFTDELYNKATSGLKGLDIEVEKIKKSVQSDNAYKELNSLISDYSSVRSKINSKGDKADFSLLSKASSLLESIQQKQEYINDNDLINPKKTEEAQRRLTNIDSELNKILSTEEKIDDNSKNSKSNKKDNNIETLKSLLSDIKEINSSSDITLNFKTTNNLDDTINEIVSFINGKTKIDLLSQEEINELDKYVTILKEIKETSKSNNAKLGNETKLRNVYSDIEGFIFKNDAMPKKYMASLREMQNRIDSMLKSGDYSKQQVKDIINNVISLKGEIIASGKLGDSFFSKIGKRITDFNSKFIAQFVSFQDILRYLRQAANAVIEIDTALTELRKVSNATNEQLSQSFEHSAETAKKLGSSIRDVISATADWSRLGYNLDEAEELARVTTLYVNVGDNIDASMASESLISTLKGFELNAKDAESIVDKFNEVANNYAIDSAGIGQALQRSAAAFNAANTDLSKSIALVTTANTIAQDPEKVGNAFTTLSARIRGSKAELEELGEETDAYVESTSKLREQVKATTGVDIMLDEDTYKDVYTILIEIGKVWKDLSDINQASLLEALAGKRQSNIMAGLLNNADLLEQIYATAEDSAGSAMREQKNYEKSIQFSLDRIGAEVESLMTNLIESDLVKKLADDFYDVLVEIEDISDDVGDVISKDVLPIVEIVMDLAKGVHDISDGILSIIPGLNKAEAIIGAIAGIKLTNIELLTSDSTGKISEGSFVKTLQKIPSIIPNVKKFANEISIMKNELSGKTFDIDTRKSVIEYMRLKEAGDEASIATKDFGNEVTNTGNKLITAGVSSKAAATGFNLIGVKAKIAAIGVGVLNTALSMGVGMLAAYGITKVISGIDKLVNKEKYAAKALEETKKKAEEAAKALNEINKTNKDLDSSTSKISKRYAELSQGVANLGKITQSQGQLSTDEYAEFLDLSNQLYDLYGDQGIRVGFTETGDAILNLSGSYNEVTKSIENMLKTQQKINFQNVLDSADKDYFKGTNATLRSKNNGDNFERDILERIIDGSSWETNDKKEQKYIEEILEKFDVDTDIISSKVVGQKGDWIRGLYRSYDFDELTGWEKEQISSYANKLLDDMDRSYDLELQKASNDIQEYLNAWVNLYSDSYSEASDGIKLLINDMIGSADYDKLYPHFEDYADEYNKDKNSLEDFLEWYDKVVIQGLDELSNDVQEKIETLFTNDGELSFGEKQSLYNEILKALEEKFGDNLSPTDDGYEIVVQFKAELDNLNDLNTDFMNHVFGLNDEKSGKQARQFYTRNIFELSKWANTLSDKQRDLFMKNSIDWEKLWNADDSVKYLNGLLKQWEVEIEEENPLSSISTAVKNMSTQIEPQLSELTSFFSSIFDFADDGITINGINWDSLDIGTLESLRAKFLDLDESLGYMFGENYINDFFNSLIEGEASVEDIQGAIDKLATEYYYTSNVLEDLNDETARTIELALKNQGVVNASDVTNYNLAAKAIEELEEAESRLAELRIQKLDADESNISEINQEIDAEYNSIDAINKKIDAYLEEVEVTEFTKTALFELNLYRELLNGNPLDSSDSINNLIAEAEAVNYTGKYYEYLLKLRSAQAHQEDLISKKQYYAAEQYQKTVDGYKNAIKDIKADELSFQPTLDIKAPKTDKDGKGGGSKSSSSDKDPVIEQYEKDLDVLEWLRDNNFIDEKEYLDQLRKLTEKTYKGNDKYAKEYYEQIQKYLQGLKELYEQAASAATSAIDEQIDKYEELREKNEKRLKEEQEAAQKAQQAKIDAVQGEIDALEDANKKRQEAINLQKSEYELERARNQRTKLVYSDSKGYHYEADSTAIRDAQENVDDAKYQIRLSKLNDELDDLNDGLDNINKHYEELIEENEKYYQSLIDPLEEYKKKWEELMKLEERAQNRATLESLGYSIEDILAMDEKTFNSFKTNYAGILGSLYENDEKMLPALAIEGKNLDIDKIGDYYEATQGLIDSLTSLDLSSVNAGINSSYDGLLSFNDGLEATQRILETIAKTIPTALQIFPDEKDKDGSGGSGGHGGGGLESDDEIPTAKTHEEILTELRKRGLQQRADDYHKYKEQAEVERVAAFKKEKQDEIEHLREMHEMYAQAEADRRVGSGMYDSSWINKKNIHDLINRSNSFQRESHKEIEDIISRLNNGNWDGGVILHAPIIQLEPIKFSDADKSGLIDYIDETDEWLSKQSEGGNVNLNLRPIIDADELNKVGWDAGEGVATIFSSTFSNESGNIAVNFTPIIADPKTGKYLGVLSPDELTRYAEEVISGVHDDYLNLQIGTEFTGGDAIEQAENAAILMHDIHELYAADNPFETFVMGVEKMTTASGESFQELKRLVSNSLSDITSEYASATDEQKQEVINSLSEMMSEYDLSITDMMELSNQFASDSPMKAIFDQMIIDMADTAEKRLELVNGYQTQYQELQSELNDAIAQQNQEQIDILNKQIDDLMNKLAEAKAELNGLEIKSQQQLNAIKSTVSGYKNYGMASGNAFASGTIGGASNTETALVGKILLTLNLFNCWKTLKIFKLQRKYEIKLNVNV